MNDTVRGLVLLVSVLLWLPFLPAVLAGDLTAEQGVLRYGCALLLSWTGGAGLSALVRGYAAQGQQRAAEDRERAEAQRRRAEDRAPVGED